jgi:hypothetical protein
MRRSMSGYDQKKKKKKDEWMVVWKYGRRRRRISICMRKKGMVEGRNDNLKQCTMLNINAM